MGPLGWQETMVIFVLALLLFGPKKLPELGKNLAKALGEFRRASNELKDTWHREMAAVERETQDIKKEAESLSQVTSNYSDSTYDYNYEYGGYGYPDSSEVSTTSATSSTPADPATASAADSSTEAGSVGGPLKTSTPEGVVPTSTTPDPVVSDNVPPAETASAR